MLSVPHKYILGVNMQICMLHQSLILTYRLAGLGRVSYVSKQSLVGSAHIDHYLDPNANTYIHMYAHHAVTSRGYASCWQSLAYHPQCVSTSSSRLDYQSYSNVDHLTPYWSPNTEPGVECISTLPYNIDLSTNVIPVLYARNHESQDR